MSVNCFSERLSVVGTTVTLYADRWVENDSVFEQVVEIQDVKITPNSKIDLLPTKEQFLQMRAGGVTYIFVENNRGVITVYSIGAAPCAEIYCSVTELANIEPNFIPGDVDIL